MRVTSLRRFSNAATSPRCGLRRRALHPNSPNSCDTDSLAGLSRRMAMVGELIAGLGAFKTMFDIAKGLKDINDAATRNAAVIELQEKILIAQAQQAALVEHVGE